MTHNALGEFEHHVLLALMRLGKKSHGAPIVVELETVTRRPVSPAAVFIALRRLEQRGYTRSTKHDARPGEGGRGRRVFEVTPIGLAKLHQARKTLELLWRSPDLLTESS